MKPTKCKKCRNPLNRSQWSGEDLKSCPACSVANGHEHIYHAYPAAFGETDKRPPSGAQSHCVSCRSNTQAGPGIRCGQV